MFLVSGCDTATRNSKLGTRNFLPSSPKDKSHRSHAEQREHRTGPDQAKDLQTVLTCRRIVVIAVKQQLVCRTADLAARRFDQAELEVPGCIVDTVKVPGHLSLRCHRHDSTR